MIVPLAAAALVAGGIAAVAGFGIGSLLTPAMAAYVPAKTAVAAVSIPHIFATAYRLWLVREHIDFRHLKSFGLMSAAGSLTGAGLNQLVTSRSLEVVLAALILFVGIGGVAGWTKKMRFEGVWAWIAGGASGFLGGLVGNQGGLRAGAMMGLGVSRDAFVATATATGLIVDLARMPIYLGFQGSELLKLWPAILTMTVGVLGGTLIGIWFLRKLSEKAFMTAVSVLLILLGFWLLAKG